MEEDYKKTIHQIITDAWRFIKSHLPVQEDDAYWDDVVNGYSAIPQKYTDTQYYDFALSVSMACINELQREYKRKE